MDPAYYNELDPQKAAWLRELMKAGVIVQGEVDERSIRDVQPEDLRGFTQCHFFAGIGVWSYALRAAGWPDDSPVWTGSCPCQSFSASGKRGGFSDQRHLWPAWFRLIRECRPDAIFGEQVASKDGLAWFDVVSSDLEGAGYAVGAADTCAAGFGAPHIRQRLYFVAKSGECGRGTRLAGLCGREPDDARRGTDGSGMANAQCPERRAGESRGNDAEWQEAGREQSADRVGEHCQAGLVADAQRPQLRAGGRGSVESAEAGVQGTDGKRQWIRDDPREHGQVGELADNSGAGLEIRTGKTSDGRQPLERPERLCATGELGHAEGRGLGMRGSASGSSGRAAQPGFTNGFWSAAEWLPCRDGKYRPVESGTFPLAHGAAARVLRLRGYGDAINAEQAKAFIEIYREIPRLA